MEEKNDCAMRRDLKQAHDDSYLLCVRYVFLMREHMVAFCSEYRQPEGG